MVVMTTNTRGTTDPTAIASHLDERIAAFRESNDIPGYVAGVYHRGEQTVVSHGTANIATAAPMRPDTGFLFGSVTKVMTATLIMRQVERELLDLDEPVVTYLPEFRLAAPGAAERIRVRNLLNHTNGIDADLFFPDAKGRDALRTYVAELGRTHGALFAPGEHISYSNGGMILAGRLLEAVTGLPYHELLQRELFSPVGMDDSCTSAEQAILRDTAVGHFPDPVHGVRRTDMFTLPDTWGPAGGTPIGTVADLLAFGRTHLADGVSPTGRRVLSAESVAQMGTVSAETGNPLTPPIGLGWLLMPFGETIVRTMSGASPGGVCLLVVVPEHDLVFAAFGNDSRAAMLHDEILLWLLRDHLGLDVPDLVSGVVPVGDLTACAGTYRSDQLRVEVHVVDGQLEESIFYEPADESQERIFTAFAGGSVTGPPRRFVPVGKDTFAPAGMPMATFTGYGRLLLVSYRCLDGGRARYRSAGGRMTRRDEAD